MKKLFITAVAVLAYSGSGFAKGIEVKRTGDCGAFASEVLQAYESEFGGIGNSNIYNFYYGYVYGGCIAKN